MDALTLHVKTCRAGSARPLNVLSSWTAEDDELYRIYLRLRDEVVVISEGASLADAIDRNLTERHTSVDIIAHGYDGGARIGDWSSASFRDIGATMRSRKVGLMRVLACNVLSANSIMALHRVERELGAENVLFASTAAVTEGLFSRETKRLEVHEPCRLVSHPELLRALFFRRPRATKVVTQSAEWQWKSVGRQGLLMEAERGGCSAIELAQEDAAHLLSQVVWCDEENVQAMVPECILALPCYGELLVFEVNIDRGRVRLLHHGATYAGVIHVDGLGLNPERIRIYCPPVVQRKPVA